jgi:succinate-semialdehyde dehydrogenase/glutarate-semialdehyde dehydrogenase
MATESKVALQEIVSTNPADGSVVGRFSVADPAQVHSLVERARATQPAWNQLGVRKRIQILRRFQRLLHAQKTQVAELISREAGKPAVEALLTEVLVVLDAVRFLRKYAYRALRPEVVPHGNPILKAKRGRLLREPYGVIAIISPWNYPFSIPATETLAALAAGNTVVLKPSEFTPAVTTELARLLHQAGVPEGVFQVVIGEGPAGAALLESRIDKVIFTGSVATGKRIAQAAAQRLLPVVLELGGKDPMIVLADADVDVASSAAVWGAFVNAGQTCLSVERCYVHRSLYDKFLAACVEKTRKLRVGKGTDPEVEVGPMIHQRQLQIVEAHVNEAKAAGARVLCGGERLPQLGPNFYAPTVIADVNHSMRLLKEETFGPVLPIMPFDMEDEAIRLANDSDFGLAASVWTGDRQRGEAIARKIHAGTVMVNDLICGFGISEAPHGGVKSSGLGRTHGKLGMEEMVRVKYLDSDLMPRMKKLWWYGYSKKLTHQMADFTDMLFAPGLGKRIRGALGSTGALIRKRL